MMKKTDLAHLEKEGVFQLIGREWMLITAGTPENFNTMTASWGGLGWLWNKPVAFVFVRPERHTYGFIEAQEQLTLSFLGEEHQDILNFCGTKSGRDCDKVAATGLRPVTTEEGGIGFEQARLVLQCRKLFKAEMSEADFLDKEVYAKWYNERPGGSLHTVYVVEIETVYSK